MIKDKAEYLMALISNFAKNHGLNVFQSYRYVKVTEELNWLMNIMKSCIHLVLQKHWICWLII